MSNLIVTPKKNSELRVCLDLRTVNSQVLRIPYQLEPLHSVFQSFHNAKYTTSIDLSNSYFSCAIEESRQPIFSFFNSRRQLLSYARCPMGYVNSGFYLEQISTKIKERCPNVVSFVDDLYLISYEDSWRDHCNKLEDLVKILVEFNLKIKAKKVQALAVTMDVLGHEWDVDLFRIPDNRVDGIIQWEPPEDGDDVASFLGHTGFYRDYLPGNADIILPLQPLSNAAIEYKKKNNWQGKPKKESQNRNLHGQKNIWRLSTRSRKRSKRAIQDTPSTLLNPTCVIQMLANIAPLSLPPNSLTGKID